MEAKLSTLQPVRTEDFDVRLLRQLAREGRLYFDPNEPSVAIRDEDRQQEILQYVSEIDDCVTPAYVPFISLIWKRIISDDQLNDQLFISKGRHQGEANRYRVMAIVNVLYEMGVYAHHTYTLLDLHHRLEHTTHKDSVYTSRLNYALTRQQSLLLRRAIKEISSTNAV